MVCVKPMVLMARSMGVNGGINELTSFQLLESAVTASAMIEAPTCASVEGVLRVASVVGSLFKSPCTYTGFSEAMVRPQLMALHVPMLTLILAPSRTFSARRKKIGGFSRSSWAPLTALAMANGHLTPGPAQFGLLARSAVSRVVTAARETPPSWVPLTLPFMEMGHKFASVAEARMFP